MNDLHVHYGQWEDKYFDPEIVCSFLLEKMGVSVIGVSSTSACRTVYILQDILNEAKTVLERWPKRVFHWLWLHPQFLPTVQELTAVRSLFHGFKIHPYIHDWHRNSKGIAPALELARVMNVPVLMHTGGNAHADAGYHLKVLKEFNDVTVVLAHARPVEQALEIVSQCPNAYMDTAFLPEESFQKIVNSGFEGRLMTGSDYPIMGEVYERDYQQDFIELYKNESETNAATGNFLGRFFGPNDTRFP